MGAAYAWAALLLRNEWYHEIKVGLDAQVGLGAFGIGLATPPKTIFPADPNTPERLTGPGCPTTS